MIFSRRCSMWVLAGKNSKTVEREKPKLSFLGG